MLGAMVKRLFIIVVVVISLAYSDEPTLFVNPHPFASLHFNPIMEGKGQRKELSIAHSSFFEDDYVRYNNHKYHRIIDFETDELSAFIKKDFYGFSFSAFAKAVYNYGGFLDNTIIWVHDHTGSTSGIFREKKEAPRNKYRFYILDENGKDVADVKQEVRTRVNMFISKKIKNHFLIRYGFQTPLEYGSKVFVVDGFEHALTFQKEWQIDSIDIFIDLSFIKLQNDKTGIKIKEYRKTGNFYISYKNRYYIQFNASESPYAKTDDSILNEGGLTYEFGFKKSGYYFGIIENQTWHNNPDVGLMFGKVWKD